MTIQSILGGVPIKYLSLIVLVVQNSALILIMRYTRTNVSEEELYLASTAVVMSEVLKASVCMWVLYSSLGTRKRSIQRLVSLLNRELILNWRETVKLAFPAGLYLIQNNLQYVAASNLDAATFQVTYQLKILTTAFFSVIILQRNLSKLKWAALSLLTVGIALVNLPKGASSTITSFIVGNDLSDDQIPEASETAIGNQSNARGIVAVLTACLLSGLAGVYFEKILKSPAVKQPVSTNEDEESKKALYRKEDEDDDFSTKNQIWIRNIQMSFFSVLLGLVFVVMLQDGDTIVKKGFFVNYTALTWVVIGIQAVGGLIVAMVVKYADNILKGFATSISIILSSFVSFWLFNFTFSGSFLLGAAMVIYATYLYGL